MYSFPPSILPNIILSITSLIDMSTFTFSTNVNLGLPLHFFHSFDLNQPTLPYCCINHSRLHMTKPSQATFYYILINKGHFIFQWISLFIYFLISNLKVYWKNTAPYIGNVLKRQKHQEIKVQCSSNPEREIQEKEGKTKHHSRRVEKKKDLNSRMDRSRSSKLLEFCSR